MAHDTSSTAETKTANPGADRDRRDALRALGRFAAATPPTVGLLLAAASRPVHAVVTSECRDDDAVVDCIPEN